MVKRAFDILLSLIALVISLIPMLIIALLIKLTSPGPVFFTQRRIGLHKKEFLILKFRTMKQSAPKNVPTHLLSHPHKYITVIGRVLRKTSLDELPQLLNIFIGHMSFVGPRPALFNQHDLIALREEKNIHAIRPGLTGWAQINGRDELPIPVKVELDHYYLNHMSLWLDIKIIFKTIFGVLHSDGVLEGKNADEKAGHE
jgi:O-antigen biosynthesis protein WbqP